jgi:hypothetical protein
MTDPRTDASRTVTASDLTDSYSTMFAVRSRWIEAGYDLEPVSVACLLSILVESGFQSTAGVAACSARRPIYFLEGGKPSRAHHMPDFGAAAAAAVPPPATGTPNLAAYR